MVDHWQLKPGARGAWWFEYLGGTSSRASVLQHDLRPARSVSTAKVSTAYRCTDHGQGSASTLAQLGLGGSKVNKTFSLPAAFHLRPESRYPPINIQAAGSPADTPKPSTATLAEGCLAQGGPSRHLASCRPPAPLATSLFLILSPKQHPVPGTGYSGYMRPS